MNKKWYKRRKRLFEIIEVGNDTDEISRAYDFINAFAIILNLVACIMLTFSDMKMKYGTWLVGVEEVTVAFFGIDYLFRLYTAKFLYPNETGARAVMKYIFSFTGIVDLLSFVPHYLPFFFPAGTIAFRMIRIVRIFRLFRINAYYDSLNVITEVIKAKSQQLISSVFIILILMIASSLCMYSLENEAQPEVFSNAFSGIWWAASTLLTVGYGDIYPITVWGKIFGIFISFLGVGMVAIPTGIISAGFVDQYSSIKKRLEFGHEADMHFIKVHMSSEDYWIGKRISELRLPAGIIISVVKREEKMLIPRGDIVIKEDDTIVLGAEPFDEHERIHLKEMVIKKDNPWNGLKIRDLDISRQSVIVLVKRRDRSLIPNGNMVLKEGDIVYLHTEMHFSKVNHIKI